MPGSRSRSVGWPGDSLPGRATLLLPTLLWSCGLLSPALAIPAEEPQLPWRGSDLQLSAFLVKNNNYESLITLCLSSVSLLSITLKRS